MSKNNKQTGEAQTVNTPDGQTWRIPEGQNEFGKFHNFDTDKVFIGSFVGRRSYDGTKLSEVKIDWDKENHKGKQPEWTCLEFRDEVGFKTFLPDHFQIRQAVSKNPEALLFRIEHKAKRKLEGGRSVHDYQILCK